MRLDPGLPAAWSRVNPPKMISVWPGGKLIHELQQPLDNLKERSIFFFREKMALSILKRKKMSKN